MKHDAKRWLIKFKTPRGIIVHDWVEHYCRYEATVIARKSLGATCYWRLVSIEHAPEIPPDRRLPSEAD